MATDETRHDEWATESAATRDGADEIARLRQRVSDVKRLRARRDTLAARLDDTATSTDIAASPSHIEQLLEYEALAQELDAAEDALARQVAASSHGTRATTNDDTGHDLGQRLLAERARAEALLTLNREREAEEEIRQLERVRAAVTGGRRFHENSTDILRLFREGQPEDA